MSLTDQTTVESARMKNIIDMALTFSAMTRILCEGSKAKIATKLEEIFSHLDSIDNHEDYEAFHQSFCQWCVQEIKTARKRIKNGTVKNSSSVSHGQSAKILDIAIKVYVYYCSQPNAEIARRLVPLLHSPIDTPIMKHLRSKYPSAGINSTTIQQIDEAGYTALQLLVDTEISEGFGPKIHRVQYDDILWNKLNRGTDHPGSTANSRYDP
jgi:hypothetical protein